MQLFLVEGEEATIVSTDAAQATDGTQATEATGTTSLTTTTTLPNGNQQGKQPNGFEQYLPIILMVAMIVLMYFVMIRPQKKRQKEEQQMRNSLRVGDEITTIGGICGRVLQVKDDALVIETGADRSKMTIKKWAIQSCDTVRDPADIDDDDDDDDDI